MQIMISLFLLYEKHKKESSNIVFSIPMYSLIHFHLGKEDTKFVQNTTF